MGETTWTGTSTVVAATTTVTGTTSVVLTGTGFTWGELPPDPEWYTGVREPRRPIAPSDSEAAAWEH